MMAPFSASGLEEHVQDHGPFGTFVDDNGLTTLFPPEINCDVVLAALRSQKAADADTPLHCMADIVSSLQVAAAVAPKSSEHELVAPPPTVPGTMTTSVTLMNAIRLLQSSLAAPLIAWAQADPKSDDFVNGCLCSWGLANRSTGICSI